LQTCSSKKIYNPVQHNEKTCSGKIREKRYPRSGGSRLQTCSSKKKAGCKPAPAKKKAGCKPAPAKKPLANLPQQKKRYGAGCKPAPAKKKQVANLLQQKKTLPPLRGEQVANRLQQRAYT
jgi:hypothetical protein